MMQCAIAYSPDQNRKLHTIRNIVLAYSFFIFSVFLGERNKAPLIIKKAGTHQRKRMLMQMNVFHGAVSTPYISVSSGDIWSITMPYVAAIRKKSKNHSLDDSAGVCRSFICFTIPLMVLLFQSPSHSYIVFILSSGQAQRKPKIRFAP